MATAPAAGTRLSPEQIAAYAYNAGFRGDALVTAVAVAMAESGGFTGAHNPSGEDSRGLWQINVAPKVRPNKWGDLYDPAVNAKAAFEVSGGGANFRPWTTFTGATEAGRRSGHARHLRAAEAAAALISGDEGERQRFLNRTDAAASAGQPATPTARLRQVTDTRALLTMLMQDMSDRVAGRSKGGLTLDPGTDPWTAGTKPAPVAFEPDPGEEEDPAMTAEEIVPGHLTKGGGQV